jgi:F-type H+-transporting ATPase subunit gamma
MSTLAQHKRHLTALGDIRDIMAALKNISLTESQRLRRFIDTQQRVVIGIEQAMGDFLTHYAQHLPGDDADSEIILLIGSERGFCGDFNERLLDSIISASTAQRILLAVGEKLGAKLQEERIPAEILAGLTTVEDVPSVLLAVVNTLRELNTRQGPTRLTIVHHHYDGHIMEIRSRQPFRDLVHDGVRHGYPPLLNIAPASFFPELMDHYLFAVLHGAHYSSLGAEHQLRLQHLQGAIEHLDRQSSAMTQRYNSLRQELITEEIELVVLSTGVYSGKQ